MRQQPHQLVHRFVEAGLRGLSGSYGGSCQSVELGGSRLNSQRFILGRLSLDQLSSCVMNSLLCFFNKNRRHGHLRQLERAV